MKWREFNVQRQIPTSTTSIVDKNDDRSVALYESINYSPVVGKVFTNAFQRLNNFTRKCTIAASSNICGRQIFTIREKKPCVIPTVLNINKTTLVQTMCAVCTYTYRHTQFSVSCVPNNVNLLQSPSIQCIHVLPNTNQNNWLLD